MKEEVRPPGVMLGGPFIAKCIVAEGGGVNG